mmetsp:Transcript_7850/g.14239  ORF Transcript_7850/g.14239 Transcript_7850/m.14239 type:complete len:344 (-) Transcript_7850:106-1137(-)
MDGMNTMGDVADSVSKLNGNDILKAENMQEFEKLYNIRDVSDGISQLKFNGGRRFRKGILMRSATTTMCTESDVKLLVEILQIHTIMDLRSHPPHHPPLDRYYPLMPAPSHEELITKIPRKESGRFEMPIIGGKARAAFLQHFLFHNPLHSISVMAPVGMSTKVVLRYKDRVSESVRANVQNTAAREMMRSFKGAGGMYKILLQSTGLELCQALQIIAVYGERPILVHCLSGKDRTGLVIALTLLACGVDRESVEKDYAISNAFAFSIIHAEVLGLPKEVFPTRETLDNDPFLREYYGAPLTGIQEALDFIEENWGSFDAYLDWIGFDSSWRSFLCDRLLEHH